MRAKLVMLLLAVAGAGDWCAAETIPPDSPRWRIEAKDSRVEEYLGRSCLRLQGGEAVLTDLEMEDGIIEADVAFGAGRGFVGVAWRYRSPGNFEQFYMRPHQSGNPDASQYTPEFNGVAGWQLYHGDGYGAPITYTFDVWTPLKVVVSGDEAEVYVGDLATPALYVDDLKRATSPGSVALTVNAFAPARFSNIRVTPAERPPLAGRVARDRRPRPGAVMSWKVSAPFDGARLDGRAQLSPPLTDGLAWTPLACEAGGLANLARLAGVARGAETVFARVTVRSERQEVKALSIGYSDRIRVYLNDRLLYSGDNTYRSRDYRYLGTIGFFDTVWLPLEEGDNELWMAVSERFGGWGVQAAFDDPEGVTVVD